MKLNKKSTSFSGPEILGTIALVLLVVVLVSIFFSGKLEAAERSINPLLAKQKNDLCAIKGKQLIGDTELKESIEGDKGDGFPDDCDLCLGGDNKLVSNSYGIPDACFMNPDKKIKTYKDMCKARGGCYISDGDRCCVGEARNKCGPECK